ncbi:MAG TPA: ABC transporter permease [Lacunisphaera sp.]|nr:ABC transporter permease [Lacunisphaera sp.]
MKLGRILRALFRRRELDVEMQDEMRHHLELQTAQNRAKGLDSTEANFTAQRQFGNIASVQERCRETRGLPRLEHLLRDLSLAARSLVRSRSHAAVVVLTLALGIGMTSTIFSVVYGVLIDPYPYARSGEIWEPQAFDLKTNRRIGFRIRDYLAMQRLPAVASAMATGYGQVTMFSENSPEIITAPQLSGTAFPFLDVQPVLGRGLLPSDFESTGDARPVVVLTFKLWQRLFNGDPAVLGRTVDLDHVPHTIVGVMPPRFGWYTDDGLWRPLPVTELDRGVRLIVRLKPGATPEAASQQLQAMLLEQARKDPGRFPQDGFKAEFKNYLDVTVASGSMRTSLQLLFGAVGFLLAIACINAANLQLARGAGRSREMAVRLALGAGRGRLVRQLLTESVVLAAAAGMLGVALAYGCIHLIVALLPPNHVPNEARVTLNGWVLGFSTLVAMASGIVSGLLPALQCSRPDMNEALKEGGHAATGQKGNRLRHAFAIAQITLSVVLLVGASLLTITFVRSENRFRGFVTENMLLLRVPLDPKRYTSYAERIAFARDFERRTRVLPGVTNVTLGLPPGFDGRSTVEVTGQPKPPEPVGVNSVDASYLATYGIALKAGRTLTESEIEHGDHVALISESAARLWSGGVSPLGRTVSIDALVGGGPNNLAAPNAAKEVTVVGIVADVRTDGPDKPAPVVIFVPYTLRARANQMFVVRTGVAPTSLLNAVRSQLRETDKEQPMLDPITFEELIEQQVKEPKFNMMLFNVLAGVALALAAAGIYSVLAYAVAQRTREIGVRMALGAGPGQVQRLFLKSGLGMVAIGVGVGTGVSVGLARVLRSLIYGEAWSDPLAFAFALGTLSVVALVACVVPARRAAKVDPMVALRSE